MLKLLKKFGLAIATVALVASSAFGADYWVSPTAGGGGSGADSLTHAMTLAEANAAATAGDVIRFKTGSYTGDVNPARDGTNANRITYRGFPAWPGAVTISGGVTLDSTSAGDTGDDYVSVSGMSFGGDITMTGGFHHAHFDTLDTCVFTGGGNLTGGYTSIVNCRVGDGSGCSFNLEAESQLEADIPSQFFNNRRNYLYNSTFNLSNVSGAPIFSSHEQESLLVDKCRFFLRVESGASSMHLMTFYGLMYADIRDSYFEGTNAGPTSCYFPSTRDDYAFNSFLRDTIIEVASTSVTNAGWLTSGAVIPGERNGHNTYDGLYIRNRGMIYYQENVTGETWLNSVLISNNTGASEWGRCTDSTTINHCTFVAVTGECLGTTGIQYQNFTVTNSIFYGMASSGCNGLWTQVNESNNTSDHNLFYRAGFPSQYSYAVDAGGCDHSQVGAGGFWCDSDGNDCNSHWASPSFADSTADWATVDPTPDPSGAAFGAWWPDGYVGAINTSTPTLSITSSSTLPDAVVGTPYSQTLAAANGTPPYLWSIAEDGGFTYYGFNLNVDSGEITSTPTSSVDIGFVVLVTDDVGDTTSKAFTLTTLSATTPPVIEAKYRQDLNCIAVTLTSDPAYTTYDLRYRYDTNLSTSTWDTFGWQGSFPGYGSFTYRWRESPTPKPTAVEDTILVWGLQPNTYQFRLVADGDTSHISNADTCTVPARQDAASFPLVGLYGGAGVGVSTGFKDWQPWLNVGGTAINTAECDSAARYDVVAMNVVAVDSASTGRQLMLAAIRRMRLANTGIKILAEPTPEAVYVYRSGSTRTDTPDTLNTYNQLYQLWRAARDGGGGWGNVGDNNGAAPGGYTDSTGAQGLLWKSKPGWKNHLWDVLTTDTGSGFSTSTWNVNLAYQVGGRYVVVDSLVEVITRNFIARMNPFSGYVWDGVMFDLSHDHIYGNTGDYAIDYTRAGYASEAAFDTAWVEAHNTLLRRLRKAAILQGRPYFIIATNNSQTFTNNSGGMEEHWPTLGGGTWESNLYNNQLASFNKVAQSPRIHWLFQFPSAANNSDSLTGGAYSVYNATDMQAVRYGLGTALLTSTTYAYEPGYAAFALGGITGGGYHRWWFDEYAASLATGTSSTLGTAGGWLGTPTTRWYTAERGTSPTRDSTGIAVGKSFIGHGAANWGDFNDAGDDPYWLIRTSATGTATVAMVTDTVKTTRALKISTHTRNEAASCVGVTFRSTVDVGANQALRIQFWGKAAPGTSVPVEVGIYSASSDIFTAGSAGYYPPRVWIDDQWRWYQIVGTTSSAGTDVGPLFWMGDTTGTVWIDDVDVVADSTTTGAFVREFQNGVVLVNPHATRPTTFTASTTPLVYNPWTAGYTVQRLTGLTGRASPVNTGAAIDSTTTIVVQPRDATFIVYRTASNLQRKRSWLRLFINIFH